MSSTSSQSLGMIFPLPWASWSGSFWALHHGIICANIPSAILLGTERDETNCIVLKHVRSSDRPTRKNGILSPEMKRKETALTIHLFVAWNCKALAEHPHRYPIHVLVQLLWDIFRIPLFIPIGENKKEHMFRSYLYNTIQNTPCARTHKETRSD